MTLTEQQFDKSAAECRSIYEKKLKDYGAAWRIMRPASLTDQIFIKANRIRSLEIKGTSMVGEGIRPELIGIINYCIIALIQLELGYAETDDLPVERALELYDKYMLNAKKLMIAKNHDYDEAWRQMRPIPPSIRVFSNESSLHMRCFIEMCKLKKGSLDLVHFCFSIITSTLC